MVARSRVADLVQRFVDSPREYCSRLTILNEENALSFLHPLWPEQRAWMDALCSGKRYVLGLKPRQVGFTTTTMAFLFWLAYTSRTARRCLQVVHEDEARVNLNEKLRLFHSMLPDELRSELTADNEKRTRFAHNGAGFNRMLAGGRGQARSWTFNDLHATEMAKWPQGTSASTEDDAGSAAEEAFSSVMAAMHDPTRRIIVESTGNGPHGLFHKLWQRASEPESEWAYVFTPWDEVDRYREDLNDKEKLEFEKDLNDDEQKYYSKGVLSLEQLRWRRTKMETEGWTSLRFRREYPLTDLEPFKLTESGWFDQDNLEELQRWVGEKGLATEPLRVFRRREQGRTYFMGVDCSGGVGRDYAVIHVLRDDLMHVATWASNRAGVPEQAQMVSRLGNMYGKPLAVIEANNMGVEVIKRVQTLGGVKLWKDDKDKDFWSTGGYAGDSKRAAMVHARHIIDKGWTTIACMHTIHQAQTVVEKSSGRIEGAGNPKNDDFIMAYVLCLWAGRGSWNRSNNGHTAERDRIRRIKELLHGRGRKH